MKQLNENIEVKKGSLKLWQFLIYLLDYQKSEEIEWINRSMLEFKIKKPEVISNKWGIHKNISNMNYEKMSRSLRYYYSNNIIKKIPGEIYAYKFTCDIDIKTLIDKSMLNNSNPYSEVENDRFVSIEKPYFIPTLDLSTA